MHKVCIVIYSLSYADIDDTYVYTNLSTMIWLQTRAKTVNYYKAQMVSYPYFQYKSK